VSRMFWCGSHVFLYVLVLYRPYSPLFQTPQPRRFAGGAFFCPKPPGPAVQMYRERAPDVSRLGNTFSIHKRRDSG
jgi:hypothetical protein